MSVPDLIDDDTLASVLGEALRTGGDFAEVFAEDKASSSAYLDDGRIEELSSGRDRGAGIRVVVGETTGFAHTADLSAAGLTAAAKAAAAAARSSDGRVHTVALDPFRGAAPEPRADPTCRRGEGHQGRAAAPGRRSGAVGRRRHHPGVGQLRRQSAPRAHRQLRRVAHRRRPGAHLVHGRGGRNRRHRHADRTREHRPHHRLRAVRPLRRRRARAHRGAAGVDQAGRPAGPDGRDARGDRSRWRRRAVPRGVRPRARGRPRRQERVGVRRPQGRDGRLRTGHARRRRHRRRRVGRLRLRRRGHPRPAQRAHRERRAHRLHVGLPPGPQGGPGPLGQRSSAELPAPARWSA